MASPPDPEQKCVAIKSGSWKSKLSLSGWMQAAQRSGGISISGVSPDPPGCHPVQPALGEGALKEGVGVDDLQRTLLTAMIL